MLRLCLYLSEVTYISALQEGKYTPAPTWKQVGSRDTQSRESRWHFVVVSKRPSPLPPPNQGNTIATFLELHSRNQLNDLLGPRHGRYAGGSATPSQTPQLVRPLDRPPIHYKTHTMELQSSASRRRVLSLSSHHFAVQSVTPRSRADSPPALELSLVTNFGSRA